MEKLNRTHPMATLEELIRLLDYPTFLAEKIADLKKNASNSDEVEGFILLFDEYNGDTLKMKNYLHDSKVKITQKRGKIIRFAWMKYVAIFFVILGVSAYFTLHKSTQNYYETYVEQDPGLPVFMSISQNRLDNWMLDYKEANYTKALKEGIKLAKKDPSNDTINYYLGVIQLELNHPEKAFATLTKIKRDASIYREKTAFLKAVCLLDINKEKAKNAFVQIQQKNGMYSGKAAEILENEY